MRPGRSHRNRRLMRFLYDSAHRHSTSYQPTPHRIGIFSMQSEYVSNTEKKYIPKTYCSTQEISHIPPMLTENGKRIPTEAETLNSSTTLTCEIAQLYCRGPLGISHSRVGALDHLRWGGKSIETVVSDLLELLKTSNLIHPDEPASESTSRDIEVSIYNA